jgi:hypothetical protein
MKSQKQAVVELVQGRLPSFVLYKDTALFLLSKDMLEYIKHEVERGLKDGSIEYSKKDIAGFNERTTYARSMVMNHLKKAKELNGNQIYGQTPAAVKATQQDKKLAKVNMDALPDDLKAYVKSLV